LVSLDLKALLDLLVLAVQQEEQVLLVLKVQLVSLDLKALLVQQVLVVQLGQLD
jgi:hypothetical protein